MSKVNMPAPPLVSRKIPISLQFWGAALHLGVLWIIIPTLFLPNFRLDHIEMIFVGHERTFGCGFHPALTFIIADLIYGFTHCSPLTPYIASFFFNIITLWAIWRLALEYLRPQTALLAVFSMFCYWYLFQMEGTRYNNNITLDTFWILGIWLAFKAIQTERFFYWLTTGIALGIGFYCKYTEIILALTLVFFLLTNREKKHLWKTPGPWISTITAFVIFLPYVLWLVGTNYYNSINYAVGNCPRDPSFWGHFAAPLEFVSNQIPLLIPPVFCLIPVCGTFRKFNSEVSRQKWENRYLSAMLLVPLVFNLLWSAIGGVYLRCDLGCHIWLPLTIWLLVYFRKDGSPQGLKRGKLLSLAVEYLTLIGFAIIVPFAVPHIEKHIPRYFFPGPELAEKGEAIWHSRYNTPLPWVTGTSWDHGPLYQTWSWEAGNVSVYGKDRARVFSGPKHCSWGKEDDVRREGGLFFWIPGDREEENLAAMKVKYPNAEILEPIILKPKSKRIKKDVVIGVAVIPPENLPE